MTKGWVGGTLVASGAILASTLGNAFVVVGFALIFLGALVVAVALESMLGAPPSAGLASPDAAEVETTATRLPA